MSFKGKRAFRRCDVKTVEIKRHVYPNDVRTEYYGGTIRPAKREDIQFREPEVEGISEKQIYGGSSAILHCPRTEDERVNVQSQYDTHAGDAYALKSLEKIAGELLCANCRYSSMSPAEVAQDRAAETRAEADRIEAVVAREKAMLELAEVGERYRNLGQ